MFKKLLLIAVILSLIVVVLGAYTRLSDAGLGCPDWPGCYGQLIVPDEVSDEYVRPLEPEKAWKEMVHRYAASSLGLVIVVIFLVSLKGSTGYRQSAVLPGFLLIVVALQGALGMLTVTELVHPGIVSMHLVGGFTTTAMLFWLILNQNKPSTIASKVSIRHKYFLVFVLVLIIFQIVLGGWTSSNYAAISCGTDFPTCQGQWWPSMDFSGALYWGPLGVDYEYGVLQNPARTAIQMFHRIGALTVSTISIALVYMFRNYLNLRPTLLLIVGLLLAQLTLGILNVVMALPIMVAVMHNLVALLLLLSVLTLIHKSFRKEANQGNLNSDLNSTQLH
jgi:cytochrome c oxidase assembly protein subunit 15